MKASAKHVTPLVFIAFGILCKFPFTIPLIFTHLLFLHFILPLYIQ